jgi:hypothetical protein
MALGLDSDESDLLAASALAVEPSVTVAGPLTIVTGQMGVGKTTELERWHRRAIDRALGDPSAPIPVFLEATEVAASSLLTVVKEQARALGDPSRNGVSLIVDGLDEAGIQVADLSSRIASLQAEWPGSTVIVGTRPQSPQSGQQWPDLVTVEPMTSEDAQSLMAAVNPDAAELRWLREALSEILRRPLFAIRHALDRRQGRLVGVDQGQMVASAAEQALDDLGDTTDEMFDLLVSLACQIVSSGGQPVHARDLGSSPAQIARLLRSRIVQAPDGQMSFQLAALTEWFAAHGLLRDPAVLDGAVSSPLAAYRWRYAFVQALRQGSPDQVDVLMSKLLARVPATASWVQDETHIPRLWSESVPPVTNADEAGTRVRRAAEAWLGPWPDLLALCTRDGKLPPLGIQLVGQSLKTAWLVEAETDRDTVVHVPPDDFEYGKAVTPPRVPSPLPGITTRGLSSGTDWPWVWARRELQDVIEDNLKNRKIFADIEMCWPELAWDFATQILDKSSMLDSEPIQRADLESVIAGHRSRSPTGEVIFGYGCALTECEAFIADLVELGVDVIESPWPPLNEHPGAERMGKTTEQLLARLESTTRTALDVYEETVRRHLPSMAPELNTYQLLPARIVGTLIQPDPARGRDREPFFDWQLEPLSADSQNDAHWSVVHEGDEITYRNYESRLAELRTLRGDFADRVTLYTFGSEPQISSPTPASSLALDLLWNDLAEFKWVSAIPPRHWDAPSTRPRYT